ncbi:probable LRR receptor-like serine/threonine-protein kinase At1g56140 isoform X3 [Humulus lupulus]|uniref:probable LRR receptor-like serine/threonine-protein kinase At1g56140 isoform X3 n=1 Tax=Humulus lupulus TaxID=3486 RepID=UPI002B403FEB|nr:probable LRR receptor-like serine/threonine-protein kinase At1g56140 isoform X3 [Humulus lupulus]
MGLNIWMYSFTILFSISVSTQHSMAQSTITDPSEVEALIAISRKWGKEVTKLYEWNITKGRDACSGNVMDDTVRLEHLESPAIKCKCTYDNNNTCHITHLKIKYNHFNGTLPAFLGNLFALEQLDVGHNTFSGTIPKELGKLKNLNMLALGTNNFSGPLPSEIGNLHKLEQLYIDSSGISGELPDTFAKLTNMKIMNALDTPLSGKIPEFIGNWRNMTSLTFQGNSLEGPIPSSFSQLISLTILKIGDLYNGNPSLLDHFINKDMENLTELILRDALISGPIPPHIGDLQKLKTLDLSFNQLTGKIPTSLFDMKVLENLFLGSNRLSGKIPQEKSSVSLLRIDLSYNNLSGNLPRWSGLQLELNFAANNLTVSDSGINRDARTWFCLQKNFPCINPPHGNTEFAIKCGGHQLTASNGIVYDDEATNIASSTCALTSSEKWAVCKVGLDNADSILDLQDTAEQVTQTNNEKPEFFQTARMSQGSLRYYGLGLVNGYYNVTLHFAEIGFPGRNSNEWASLARRVFNIYIQGVLVKRDFDISKEAGGVLKAISRPFRANVTENYLEIHLFWAGKGTCCIPKRGYYGPLITAVHATADFKVPQKGDNKTGLVLGIVIPTVVVGLAWLLIEFYMRRKPNDRDEELLGIGPKPDTFTYAELRAATGDFSASNKLGEGGFGNVYKGTLLDGREVAVKQLSVNSNHGKTQFIAEIATISVVQHRNLVKLYGCCIQGNRHILVYEFLPNRSLDQALFGKNNLRLDWPTRFNICLGTARGLAYLHEESRPRIIHRDVKASNILLDEELCPKISDFGLAKLYDDKKTHMSTRVAGTIGYLAPEYAMWGHLTEKADIFGFGVVALEILSGKPNFYSHGKDNVHLLERAWTLDESNKSLELVDPLLAEYDEIEAKRMIKVALLCTQGSPTVRPPMSRVAGMLVGDIEIDNARSKPSYLTDMDYRDTTTFSTVASSLSEAYTPSISFKSSSCLMANSI